VCHHDRGTVGQRDDPEPNSSGFRRVVGVGAARPPLGHTEHQRRGGRSAGRLDKRASLHR
jgi:hypothetical protein